MAILSSYWYTAKENWHQQGGFSMQATSVATLAPVSRAAVRISLVCVMLWPLNLALYFVVNILGNHQIPAALAASIALILLLAPPIGSIAGSISVTQPTPWRRLALVALVLNILWLVGIFLASDLGAAVVVWLHSL
jgi:hypothetical protein